MLSYDPAKTIETYRKFRLSRVGAGKSKNRPVEDVQWTLVGLPWLVKWRDFQKTRIVLSPTRDWRPRGHALQATGKPDTPGNLKGAGQGVVKTAWAAKTPNAGREWLQLSFPETVTAKSLSVVEAGVSGAVTSVICFTNGGKPQVVWQRKKNAKGPSLLPRQIVLETPVKTDRVKILLDTALVRGFNQIDAVELTDVTGKKSYALSAEASSNHYSGTWRWKVVPAGTLVTNLFKAPLFESAESQPLLSGRYDVYLCPRGEEGEKVIPHAYCIVRGLRVNSGYRSHANFEGIALRTDEQIGSVHSWFAIQSGSSAITTIEPQPGDTSMPLWVRPGRYDVYCRLHKYGSARLLKRGVEVSRFQLSKVDLNSGIRLEVGKFAPARDKRYGCWGIVPKGEVPDRESKLLNMTRTDSSLLVPPGLYDIYWKQGYYYSPSLIASGIRVGTSLRKVTVHSGIRLKGPDTLFKVNKSYGFWGVVPAGADPKNPSHKSIGAKESHLLVPPGKYDIVWKKEYRSAVKVLKKSVVVESDKLLILEIQ